MCVVAELIGSPYLIDQSCTDGKDRIRVFRIVRNGKWHEVVEYTVCALLEG